MNNQNSKYNYVLQWFDEAKLAMDERLKKCQRNLDAYHHKPQKNTYKENAMKYNTAEFVKKGVIDQYQADMICTVRERIPEGRSDIVYRSVETNVNQLSGGMGAFQVSLYDPASVLEDGFEQKLSLAAERIYHIYGLDSFRDVAVRDMMLFGAAYIYPYYDHELKDIAVERISIDKMILDPIRFVRNHARYIGFHKTISWQELEKEITFKGKFVKTFNEAKLEAKNIEELMENREANSAIISEFEQRMDRIGFKYKSNATEHGNENKKKYNGEDVELAFIWDLSSGDRFTILNRKYIVGVDEKALDCATEIENELSYQVVKTKLLKKIKSPIIEIPYKVVADMPYPTTPLDEYGDDFDEICSLVSIKKHNESIAAILTPQGQANDLAILANTPPISGVGVHGMDGQVGFLSRGYDAGYLDARIEARENKIREALSAYSQIDMTMMVGDRATAREVSAANGAIAAGHNALIHNIEIGFADVLRVVNLLMVKHRYNKAIKVQIEGDLATIPVEALALDAVLNVKLKSEVDRQKDKMSMMATQAINMGVNNPFINQEIFVPKMIEIAFGNLLTRAEIRDMVKTPEDPRQMALAEQEAQNRAMELNNEQKLFEEDPEGALGYMFDQQATPEDREQLISDMSNQHAEMPTPEMGGIDTQRTRGGVDKIPDNQTELAQAEMVAPDLQGTPPELAGLLANGTGL